MNIIEIFVSYANDMNTENFGEVLKELKKEENISILDCFDWGEIIEESEADFSELNYDLIQEIFLKTLKFDSEDNEAKEVFFSLMYIIDKEKAESDIVKSVKDVKLIEGIRFGYSFEVSDEELKMFKVVVIGLINGMSKEETIKKEEEQILLEKKADEKILKAKELLENIDAQFKIATKDATELDKFKEISIEIADYDDSINILPFRMAHYSTKLVLAYMQSGNFDKANEVFENYVDELLPKLGFNYKTYDLASFVIVIAITTKNDKMFTRVFEDLFKGDFDIENVENEIFLFNLSCYYAVKEDKESLIKAVRQAIKHGKEASQFLNDGDFKAYYEDEDFLEALKG